MLLMEDFSGLQSLASGWLNERNDCLPGDLIESLPHLHITLGESVRLLQPGICKPQSDQNVRKGPSVGSVKSKLQIIEEPEIIPPSPGAASTRSLPRFRKSTGSEQRTAFIPPYKTIHKLNALAARHAELSTRLPNGTTDGPGDGDVRDNQSLAGSQIPIAASASPVLARAQSPISAKARKLEDYSVTSCEREFEAGNDRPVTLPGDNMDLTVADAEVSLNWSILGEPPPTPVHSTAVANSLGCRGEGEDWSSGLATPVTATASENQAKNQRGLSTEERKELLPSAEACIKEAGLFKALFFESMTEEDMEMEAAEKTNRAAMDNSLTEIEIIRPEMNNSRAVVDSCLDSILERVEADGDPWAFSGNAASNNIDERCHPNCREDKAVEGDDKIKSTTSGCCQTTEAENEKNVEADDRAEADLGSQVVGSSSCCLENEKCSDTSEVGASLAVGSSCNFLIKAAAAPKMAGILAVDDTCTGKISETSAKCEAVAESLSATAAHLLLRIETAADERRSRGEIDLAGLDDGLAVSSLSSLEDKEQDAGGSSPILRRKRRKDRADPSSQASSKTSSTQDCIGEMSPSFLAELCTAWEEGEGPSTTSTPLARPLPNLVKMEDSGLHRKSSEVHRRLELDGLKTSSNGMVHQHGLESSRDSGFSSVKDPDQTLIRNNHSTPGAEEITVIYGDATTTLTRSSLSALSSTTPALQAETPRLPAGQRRLGAMRRVPQIIQVDSDKGKSISGEHPGSGDSLVVGSFTQSAVGLTARLSQVPTVHLSELNAPSSAGNRTVHKCVSESHLSTTASAFGENRLTAKSDSSLGQQGNNEYKLGASNDRRKCKQLLASGAILQPLERNLQEEADIGRESRCQEPADEPLVDFPPHEAVEENTEPEHNNYCGGFSTASGKSIRISEEAVARAKRWLAESGEPTDCLGSLNLALGSEMCNGALGIETGQNEKSNRAQQSNNMLLTSLNAAPSHDDYATVRSRKIKVFGESIVKAKSFLEDLMPVPSENKSISSAATALTGMPSVNAVAPVVGFATAGGRKINISSKAIAKAKELLGNNLDATSSGHDYGPDAPISMPAMVGFSTAAGKKISISKESLRKAKAFLRNTDCSDLAFLEDSSYETTDDGANVTGNEENKMKTRAATECKGTESGPSVSDISDECSVAPRFSTASGKTISISKESILKAKAFMENVRLASGSIAEEKSANFDSASEVGPHGGFATAGGKKIHIAEESLLKAKALMSGVSCGSVSHGRHESSEIIMLGGGFSTAVGGTKSTVSIESVFKAKAVNPGRSEKNPVLGFATAGGKTISVSEAAIAKAKAFLYVDKSSPRPDMATPKPPSLSGFATAGGRRIDLSEAAIAKAKAFLADTGTCNSEESLVKPEIAAHKPQSLAGFATAGGSRIPISEEAIAKAKAVMDAASSGDWLEATSSNEVPETTSGQNTDTGFSDKRETQPGVSTIFLNRKSHAGFATAGGKKITISEEALAKAKALWDKADEADNGSKPKSSIDSPVQPASDPVKEASHGQGQMSKHGKDQESDSERRDAPKRKGEEDGMESNPKKSRLDPSQRELMVELYEEDTLDTAGRIRSQQEECLRRKKAAGVVPSMGQLLAIKLAGKKGGSSGMLRLRDLALSATVDPSTRPECLGVTAESAGDFRFPATWLPHHTSLPLDWLVVAGKDGRVGCAEVCATVMAMPGVDPRLLPQGWIENHYRWIVWSLACLERRGLAGQALTLQNLLVRLKLRYDREIDRAERPILRKIMEKDESPARPMILLVGRVDESRMELTDGWYSLPCPLPYASPLQALVLKGFIAQGTKLWVQGAELVGGEQGCHPLEDRGTRTLNIYVNSCRRVAWWMKLGASRPFCLPLRSLIAGGGSAPLLKVVVVRRYPLLYCIKTANKTEYLNEKQWLMRQDSKEEEKRFFAIWNRVQKELEEPKVEKRRKRLSIKELAQLHTGEDLLEHLTEEPGLWELLSQHQLQLVTTAREQQLLEQRIRIQEEVARRLGKDTKDVTDQPQQQEATPLLRLRLVDINAVHRKADAAITSGLLTIWRPEGRQGGQLEEGQLVALVGCQVSRLEAATIHLTAGRATQYLDVGGCREAASSLPPEFKRCLVEIRHVGAVDFRPAFNEVDLVGLVLKVGEPRASDFQSVYICDRTGILVLEVWSSTQISGYAETLAEGSVVACRDLEWRPAATGRRHPHLPRLYAREYSTVTANPRSPALKAALDQLRRTYAEQPDLLDQQRTALSCLLLQPNHRRSLLLAGPAASSNTSHMVAESPPATVRPAAAAKQALTAWQLMDTVQEQLPLGKRPTAATLIGQQMNADTPPASRASTEERLARLDAYTQSFAARFGPGQSSATPPPPSPVLIGRSKLVSTPYRPPRPSSSMPQLQRRRSQTPAEDSQRCKRLEVLSEDAGRISHSGTTAEDPSATCISRPGASVEYARSFGGTAESQEMEGIMGEVMDSLNV